MHPAIVILILLASLYMAWQDFTDRAIDWFLFPILFMLLVANGMVMGVFAWSNLLVNVGLLVAQLLLLVLYFKLNKQINLFAKQELLGWGDILFFLILTAAFSPLNFIAFYICSLIITLLFFLLLPLTGRKVKNVPLAGCQAVMLVGVFMLDIKQWGLYLYNDTFLLNFLSHARFSTS